MIGKHEGEIGFEAFDGVLREMVRQFDERGLIDRRPVDFVTEREQQSGGPLSFPGKVLADRRSDRLFIADTTHNRVVVASADGRVRSIVGSGKPGLADGAFEESRFDGPQGLELVSDDTLYVADAGNHAIRRVDLANRHVKTIAGTGQQAMSFHRRRHRRGRFAQLALGPGRCRRIAVYSDGRFSSAMATRFGDRRNEPVCGKRPRGHRGRAHSLGGAGATERRGRRRRPALLRRQRDQLDQVRRPALRHREYDRGRWPVHVWRRRRRRRPRPPPACPRRRRMGRARLRDGYLQQQDQVCFPGRAAGLHRGGSGAGGRQGRRRRASPSCTNRPGSARRMASSTWPTRTTTRSVSSTRTPGMVSTLELRF